MSDEEKSSEPKVKVTDRRMFGPDGQLREEYRFLEESRPPGGGASVSEQPTPPKAAAATAERGTPGMPSGSEPAEPRGRPLEIPTGAAGQPAATFFDLLSILSDSVAVYLGDVALPDGRSVEDLEMARIHIDLLDVLRRKTAGNLTAQESSVLEDLLYQLRMRYVQKRG